MAKFINWRTCHEFIENNKNASKYLIAFKQLVENISDGEIKNPAQMKTKFGKRFSPLKGNRFCLDIGGTKIRAIIVFEFTANVMDIRWVGWHKDYTKLCDSGGQYTV